MLTMFRFRRYRTFIVFAFISVLAFYHFSTFTNWDTATTIIGVGSPKQASVPSTKDSSAQKEQNAPQLADSTKTAEASTANGAVQEPLQDALHTAATPAPVAETFAGSLLTTTTIEEYDSAPTVPILSGQISHEQGTGTIPRPEDLYESTGESIPAPLPAVKKPSPPPAIHWSRQPEHFPVSSTIRPPPGTPKPIPKIQATFARETEEEKAERKLKLKAVKDVAEHAWAGYKANAWMHDEVRPVSGSFKDPFCGWAATLVDALDTLWIMGMKDEFEDAVRAVGQIDFTTSTRRDIPLFETTIRYLGGLVSAYDISDAKYTTLLDKAVELAEVLISAFDTPNRMPMTYYHWMPTFSSQPHRAATKVVLAEIGSLSMEFTRLAQITKEPKYYDAVARITDAFYEWQNEPNGTLVPGLWPTFIDASGCDKPAQIKSKPLPVLPSNLHGDEDEDAGQPIKFDKSIPQGPLSDVAKNDKVMQGDEPVRPDEPSATVAGGRMGRIAGWDEPVGEGGQGKKAAEEGMPQGADVVEPSTAQAGGNAGRIAGWDEPIYEGSVEYEKAAKAELADEIHKDTGSSKHKRQLVGELAETSNPAPTPNQTSNPKSKKPALSETEICIPRGLMSSSHSGRDTFTIGSMADSTYEYLPKQHLLLGGLEPKYQSMYEKAMDATIDKLLFRPMTPNNDDILFTGEYMAYSEPNNLGQMGKLKPEAAHLSCFAGGMFAMGSKIFGRKNDLDIGAKLTEGCVWAYASTNSGIMPESAILSVCEDKTDCTWNQTRYWDELDPYRSTREKSRQKQEVKGVDMAIIESERIPGMSYEGKSGVKAAAEDVAQGYSGDKSLNKRQVQPPSAITRPGIASFEAKDVPTKVQSTPMKPHDPHANHMEASNPKYTPLTHEEFVLAKIEDERLPPGFTSMSNKHYILR